MFTNIQLMLTLMRLSTSLIQLQSQKNLKIRKFVQTGAVEKTLKQIGTTQRLVATIQEPTSLDQSKLSGLKAGLAVAELGMIWAVLLESTKVTLSQSS